MNKEEEIRFFISAIRQLASEPLYDDLEAGQQPSILNLKE